MTGERRMPWRVEDQARGPLCQVYEGDRFVGEFVRPADAALAVSAVNAGGDCKGAEPVVSVATIDDLQREFRDGRSELAKLSGYTPCWLKGVEMFVRRLKAIAAPVAIRPESAGEVEQRVSEDKLIEIIRYAAPQSHKQYLALDLRDARAALARQPAGQWRRDMASAPRDGTEIYINVAWTRGPAAKVGVHEAKWRNDCWTVRGNAFPEDQVDAWMPKQPLPAPPDADTPDNRETRRLAEGGDGS